MFTLAISCLTTSHLLLFMDLTLQIPTQYCSLQQWILLSPPDISATVHSLLIWPIHFVLSETISNCLPLFPSSILDSFQPGEGGLIFWCLFLSFYTVCGVLMAYWVVCHFLLQSTMCCQNSPLWPVLNGMAHSFIELHKTLFQDKAMSDPLKGDKGPKDMLTECKDGNH